MFGYHLKVETWAGFIGEAGHLEACWTNPSLTRLTENPPPVGKTHVVFIPVPFAVRSTEQEGAPGSLGL